MPTIDETIAFITAAHAGQTDKTGAPYWRHPVSVMERFGSMATEEEKLAALLHDVVEDTAYTLDDLRHWIRAITASGTRIAIRVKIADNEDNADPRGSRCFPAAARICPCAKRHC